MGKNVVNILYGEERGREREAEDGGENKVRKEADGIGFPLLLTGNLTLALYSVRKVLIIIHIIHPNMWFVIFFILIKHIFTDQ